MPALLIAISLVPFAATTNRLLWLADPKAQPDPVMAHFSGEWTALVVHILFGTMFLILAAFQFSPELRRQHKQWHRISGRLCMIAGLIAGLSSIWLVLGFPSGHLSTPAQDFARALMGAALIVCIVKAFVEIRKGNIVTHSKWVVRAFALGVAGTTQAFLIGFWIVFSGNLTPKSATVLIIAGFAFNILFAQWRIHCGLPSILKPRSGGMLQ